MVVRPPRERPSPWSSGSTVTPPGRLGLQVPLSRALAASWWPRHTVEAKLRKHGLSGLAGRNTARLALATDLPAAVLSEVTGTSVHNATRWSRFVKRDWADYIVTRRETGLS
ncbi:hypothetical protein ACFYZB_38535 [Streptomyces sp. NPDC001852]|uniref:hypothetical protein n=1 Tax=Streptomyces sp. NPDC001852 TaxID=3364619 RepID=UPI00368CF6C1